MRPILVSLLAAFLSLPVAGQSSLPATAGADEAARPAADGTSWGQWRGPTRDGRYHGPKWPGSIGERALTEVWRVDVGPGYAGPVVTHDRVFTVETKDKQREIVRAFDRKTGEQLWETRWDGSMRVPFFAGRNGSWARSTPAFDGESLYVAGMRDVLVCLDAKTGKINWRVDFMERYETPLPAFGFVSSPLVHGDHVYVQAGASFVKLDKKTGQSVWRSLKGAGGMYGSAFSSPVLSEIAGRPQLLVQMRETLSGVDPESGKCLWSQRIKAMRGMNILTPTVYKGSIFTSAHSGKTELYSIAPPSDGGDMSANRTWQNKLQAYMSQPAIIDGHAYLHLKNRRFSCIDLDSGEIKWITKERFGGYWSMVTQGDRMLALDQKGVLRLIRADPEKFDLIEERKLTDAETWAHLAVVDGYLFVRELKALVAYRWKKARRDA